MPLIDAIPETWSAAITASTDELLTCLAGTVEITFEVPADDDDDTVARQPLYGPADALPVRSGATWRYRRAKHASATVLSRQEYP